MRLHARLGRCRAEGQRALTWSMWSVRPRRSSVLSAVHLDVTSCCCLSWYSARLSHGNLYMSTKMKQPFLCSRSNVSDCYQLRLPMCDQLCCPPVAERNRSHTVLMRALACISSQSWYPYGYRFLERRPQCLHGRTCSSAGDVPALVEPPCQPRSGGAGQSSSG